MVDRHVLNAGCLALLAAISGATSAAPPGTATPGAGRNGGIWKAAVPPKPMQGEFDNLDPMGVAAGARISADCSLNWINPDDGKLYCFSSGTSLQFFLDRPHASIERARRGWKKLAMSPK